MNPNEFKAWLNGFAQGIGEAPTAEQWKMVLQKAQSLGSIINFQPNDFERKLYEPADGRAAGQVTSDPSVFEPIASLNSEKHGRGVGNW